MTEYRLLRHLGHGRLGPLHLATQGQLERPVTFRNLEFSARSGWPTPAALLPALREAARLQHPGIVRVIEAGESQGQSFLVTEYVDGENLAQVSRGRPLDPHVAARHVAAVAEALHYAHGEGVWCGELKLSSVLIGRDGRPRVTDFGLHRGSGPEPRDEAGVTRDIRRLGGLLYDLLTGLPPFLPGSMLDGPAPEAEGAPGKLVAPRLLNPKVPRDLEAICLKCVEPEANRRYATAAEVAADLAAFLRDDAITARSYPWVERAVRGVRRNLVALVATGVSVLSLLVAGGLMGGAQLREEAARQQALEAREKNRRLAEMIQELLAGLNPSVAQGRDTTLLRELLDTATARFTTRLEDQPEVQADLFQTLGLGYTWVGQFDVAEALFRKALALRSALLGRESPDVADTLFNLGSVLFDTGRLAEAEPVLREALEVQLQSRGPDDMKRNYMASRLAALYWRTGRAEEAENMARGILETSVRVRGQEHLETLKAMGNLAFILNESGRSADAEALLRRALEVHRRLDPPMPVEMAGIMAGLGWALFQQGRVLEGEGLLREALELQERSFAEGRPEIADTRGRLGQVLVELGRCDEATPLLQAALPVVTSVVGPEHTSVVAIRQALDRCSRTRP